MRALSGLRQSRILSSSGVQTSHCIVFSCHQILFATTLLVQVSVSLVHSLTVTSAYYPELGQSSQAKEA